jgi:hypothetical protein
MTELQRKERRGKRLIGWGAGAALLFASLTAGWTTAFQVSGYHLAPPAGMNPSWVLSAALLLATLAGVGAALAGVVVLARLPAADDERRARTSS